MRKYLFFMQSVFGRVAIIDEVFHFKTMFFNHTNCVIICNSQWLNGTQSTSFIPMQLIIFLYGLLFVSFTKKNCRLIFFI